ncbi:MAG: glycosyltransferase, partial [Deltaproteobacteria bacterium]|nr:glycosyltransferase [Deltaproteobacteria bacterium]
SPFEAMCALLPVIVSSEMTAAQIVISNTLGIVTDQYADALMDVFLHPEKYRQMALTSAVWVQQNLNWDNFCGQMVIVFERTIQAYNR